MKIYKVIFAMLLVVSLMLCQAVSYASLFPVNTYLYGGVTASLWYTKLINLQGYRGRDVKGTLHFELVPDTETKPYEYKVSSRFYNPKDPDDPGNFINVSVAPGEIPYKYDVPFSSDDFVDPEFNRLARKASLAVRKRDDQAYKAIDELFDHAFLHEWGTIQSSDHGHTARVRKVLPSQFECVSGPCDSTSYDEFVKEMDEINAWVHWKNDPETKVTGWKCSQESPGSKDPTKGFGSYEEGCQSLAEYPKFLDGTFRYSKVFALHANPVLTYSLANITRPIAISKTYDSFGNITSIEKPLFPSLEQHIFTDMILEKEPYYRSGIKVYRYILKEKPATGIALNIPKQEIIVDVVVNYSTCTVYMYKDRETANKQRYDFNASRDQYFVGGNPLPNEFTSAVKLENKYPSDEYPLTGDSMNIVLYIGLIALSMATALYFIKRKTNN